MGTREKKGREIIPTTLHEYENSIYFSFKKSGGRQTRQKQMLKFLLNLQQYDGKNDSIPYSFDKDSKVW